jgi:glycosyltransferase involved in cell wall biosynthesis
MKIFIAADYPYEETVIKGGIANVVYNLVQGYKNGRLNKIIVFSVTSQKSKTIDINPNIKVVFKHIPSLPQTLNAFLFEAYFVKKEIQRVKPDIVHSHNMTGYTIGAIKSGYPCLITPHGDWISEQLNNSKNESIKTNLKVFIWKKIYKYIFTKGKVFSAISPYVEELIKSYNPSANIFRINNPLSDAYYKTNNYVEKENRILWAGRICKLKRLDIAIEIFKSLIKVFPNLIFEVAGQPDAKTEKEFIRLRREAIKSLGNNIVFHGHLSREDMIKSYDRAKIFLLTSEQEASPMVIIEAMARGCVPVVFDLPGIRHLIKDGVNGIIVKNRQSDQLILKIIDMLNKPSLLDDISIRGIKASFSFSINNIIEEYISVFKQIM